MCCGVKLQFLGLAPSTPESAPPCLLNFASGQRGYSSQHVGLNKGPRLPHVHISSCPSVQFNFIDFIGFFPPNLACFCLDSCALLASLCSYPIQAEKGRDPICYQLLDTFALAASNWTQWGGGKTYLSCCHKWIKGPSEHLPYRLYNVPKCFLPSEGI